MENQKIYTAEGIKEKLLTDQQWLERGIIAIFNRQTNEEKSMYATKEHNSIGFNGVDAGIMSSFANWILRGRSLTAKQTAVARKKMVKYSGQLANIANGG